MAYEPVTNVGLILKEFRDKITTMYSLVDDYSNLKVIMDPELTYESAIKRLRYKHQKEITDRNTIPLFAFNRSPLRYNELTGKRSVVTRALQCTTPDQEIQSSAYSFDTFQGEFDINFFVIFNDMRFLEAFEITYLTETMLSNSKSLTLDLGDFGKYYYRVDYNNFDDLVFQTDSVAHKGLTGTIKVSGPFFVLKGEVALIQKITAEIKSFYDEVYSTIIIDKS